MTHPHNNWFSYAHIRIWRPAVEALHSRWSPRPRQRLTQPTALVTFPARDARAACYSFGRA